MARVLPSPWTKLAGAFMPPVRLLLVPLALVLGPPAWAQAPVAAPAAATPVEAPRRNQAPDDAAWTEFPGRPPEAPPGAVTAPLPEVPDRPPLLQVEEAPPRGDTRPALPPELPAPTPAPVPNRVSLLGARTVGAGGVAVGFSLGFPTLSARAAVGVTSRFDVLLGFDSLYGLMNEARLGWRWSVLDGGPRWSLGVVMEASHAFFLRSARAEERGARYVTGRRNWNVMPGLVGTFQFEGHRAKRMFLDTRYLLTVDTEPTQRTPLGGLPPDQVSASAWTFRVGAEMPLSEKTSYFVSAGGDVRGRSVDADFMPVVSVGIVTGL
ncbi:hypothetical protein NVS55_06990 [Myxococcus stipitatus]|uniref:hypothetical protein n=1 Tax=Myxococcus stipitatus TaxID=83455 RepID=UPI003144FE27